MVLPRVLRTNQEYFYPMGIIFREESEEMRKQKAKGRNKESPEEGRKHSVKHDFIPYTKKRKKTVPFIWLSFYNMVHLTLFTTANFRTEESGGWQLDCPPKK